MFFTISPRAALKEAVSTVISMINKLYFFDKPIFDQDDDFEKWFCRYFKLFSCTKF